MFEENGNTFVLKVWCKIGAKYKPEILRKYCQIKRGDFYR